MRIAVVVVVALGCGAAHPEPRDRQGNAVRLELVEGRPQTLADGTVVDITGIGYAHLPDAKNLSTCTLVLHRGAETLEVVLAREHGGADPEASALALGWRFSLEVADPYRRPARAVVEAQKL